MPSTKQETMPCVSLVTPVYNAMPYFRDYLSCVMAQTWRPLQFIAIDDGSTDGSYEYLMGTRRAMAASGIDVLVLRIPHSGQAAAVGAALPLLSGEFFTWCDADDILTQDSIEKKAHYLLAHPDLGMVRSDGGTVLDGRKDARPIARAKDRGTQNIFDALFHQETYCLAGCYMLRTKLFFHCYPQKRIPLSLEGQNLQLLLPPASRTECGFVPDRLFYYHMRKSGHSSRRQSYTKQVSRIENFARLRAEILSYCDCDQNYYRKENERMRQADRMQLLRVALTRAREEMHR